MQVRRGRPPAREESIARTMDPTPDHAAREPDSARAPVDKGIDAVAKQLGVTQRTLRFYEDKGLIEPERVGTTRIYSRRDIARMQLILRGKRVGFTIREIREFLDLYDADPDHHEQMDLLLSRVRSKLAILRRQRVALEQTIGELEQMEREALSRLT